MTAMNAAWLHALSDKHVQELKRSGISLDVARQHGIASISDPLKIAVALGWQSTHKAGELGSCLCIPYFETTGKRTTYRRLKPEHPPLSKTGKPSKYLGPKGILVGVYFPLLHRDAYHSIEYPLILTEGEKKALCGAFFGFPTIGIGGVSCWSEKRKKDNKGRTIGQRELNPALAAIPWKGRRVYIAFDSDRSSKPDVMREEWLLSQALIRAGADVRIVHLPPGSHGKQGLDDYLVAHGVEAFQELLESATSPVRPEQERIKADTITNPHYLAASFLATQSPAAKVPQFHCWNNEFIRYSSGAYHLVSKVDVQPLVTAHVRHEFLNERGNRKRTREVKTCLINDVTNALRSICHLPSTLQPPAWIQMLTDLPDPYALLPMRNGLLQLGEMGVIRFHPLNPNFFTMNAVPYDYSEHNPIPTQWLAFLHSLWPDDEQAIRALQEWFGYLLTADTRQQKILMLIGPKRSGKGTILRILERLVGESNVVNPTLSSLSGQFGLAPLIGKTIAVISDARFGNRHDQAMIIERLLSISGEDVQTIERKHRDSMTCRLLTRFVMASNELPRLCDTSGALAGRMIILKLCHSYYGKEDTDLAQKLYQELPGILKWAIEGLVRLRQRGYFLQPESGLVLAEEMHDLSSPVGAFVREKCILESSAVVPVGDLYQAWRTWCVVNGRDHPGSQQTFGRDLHAAVPNLKDSRPATDGKRFRCYLGIRLRRDEDELLTGAPSAQSADSTTASHRKSNHTSQKENITNGAVRNIADVADCADGAGKCLDQDEIAPGVYKV